MNETSLQKIENITENDLSVDNFDTIKVYVEDSHLTRRLLRHKPSGELYFYEFKEEIDYENGNDPQYRTYIPVENEERADEINKLDSFGILSLSPRIIKDWLADDTRTIKWIR